MEQQLKGKLGSAWSDSRLKWESTASDALKGISSKDFSLVGGTADNPQPSSSLSKFLDAVLGTTFAADNSTLTDQERLQAQIGLMGETIRGTLSDIADKATPALNDLSRDWTDKERKIGKPLPGESADDAHTLHIGLKDLPPGRVISSTDLTLSNVKGGPGGKEENRTPISVKVHEGSIPSGTKGRTKDIGTGKSQPPGASLQNYLSSLTAEERKELEAEANRVRLKENAQDWLNMEMKETKELFGLKDDEALKVQMAIDNAAIEAETTGKGEKLETILNALTVINGFKSGPSLVPESVLKYGREDANIQSLYSVLLRKERERREASAKEKAASDASPAAGTFGRQPGSALDEGMKEGIYGHYTRQQGIGLVMPGEAPTPPQEQYTTTERIELFLGGLAANLDDWWRGK